MPSPTVTLVYAAQSTGSYSTISGSASFSCVGGETIAIYCAGLSTSDIGAPTDSAGSLTKQTAAYNAFVDSSKTHGGWYTEPNASAGTHTITPPAIGGGSDGLIFVYRISGMPSSLNIRTTAKAQQVSSSQSFSLTTIGSATAGDIALGGRTHENSVGFTDTITQPSGWTSDGQYLNGSTNLPTDVSHFTVASTAALSATWTSVDSNITDTSGAIIVLVPLSYTAEQEGYRWRDDDGSETTATFLASQDTDITRTTGLNTRLRLLANMTGDAPSNTYQLEYRLSSGSYRKVEAAGGGSIAYGTQGANTTTGTTAPSVAYPASISAGDLLILAIINRPNAQTPSTPSGWTAGTNYTVTGGAGVEGADTGTIRVTVFTKEADGTETGSLTLAITSGTSCAALMWRATKTTGKDWSVALASGSDNSAGTAWSATFGSDPGVTAGDLVFVASGACVDTASWASQSLSQTGVTYAAMTERADFAVTTGNDLRLVMTEHPITSGTSSAAGVYTATTSGTNSANTAGASIMIRLRQVDQPIQLSLSSQFADGASTTAQLTAPSGKSTSDFVAGKLSESSNPAAAVDITTDDYTELEWCMTATSNAANADVYQFRLTISGSVFDTYSVTPQWTIGSGAAGATLTGQVAALSGGSVTASNSNALTGQALATARGSASPGVTIPLSGSALAAAAGSTSPDIQIALTGQALSFAQGSLTASTGGDVTLALSGQVLTASSGSLAPATDRALAGNAISGGLGTVAPDSAQALAGQALTLSQGTITFVGDVTVSLTGLSMSLSQGSLTAPSVARDFSGGFFYEYERERHRRQKIRREQEEREEEARELQDKVDAEIALLLHAKESEAERREELDRLQGLVRRHSREELYLSDRAKVAYTRALRQANFSAMEALDRELQRQIEEEDTAVLMLLLEEMR